jgi:hypothetical protein
MNKMKYLAVILIGVAGLGLQQAQASDCFPTIGNDCTSTLNKANGQLGGGTGNFGTVEVTLSGQTATILFTAGAGYAFVDGGAAAINVNSTNFSHSATATESPTNNFKNFTARQEDSFGQFNLAVNNKSSNVQIHTISFTVTNLDLAHPWVNASDVLVENANGFDAAAHVIEVGGQGRTGYVGEGSGTVPDGGATVMLLGAALGALGMVRRYLAS